MVFVRAPTGCMRLIEVESNVDLDFNYIRYGGIQMETDNIMEFKRHLEENNLSVNTINVYIRAVKYFYEVSKGASPDSENVKQFELSLIQNYSRSTANLYSVAFNSYLRFLKSESLCIKTKRLSVKRSLENIITVAQYKELLKYAKDTHRDKYYYIIKVLACTGIRIGELKFITVENVRSGNAVICSKGRSREIYISEELQTGLELYCKNEGIKSGTIFTGSTRKPISRGAVWQMLMKMADMTGIPKSHVHPHSFRHMMAIEYMSRYKNISELADILGHSSIEITRIYTMTTKEEKRKRLNKLYS